MMMTLKRSAQQNGMVWISLLIWSVYLPWISCLSSDQSEHNRELTSSGTQQSPSTSKQLDEAALRIKVTATPESCSARINGRHVLYAEKRVLHRKYDVPASNMLREGLYTVSVNPSTGTRTGQVFSHGNIPNGAYFALQEFYDNVQDGHIVILCVLAEASISLDRSAMEFFTRINSSFMWDLQARSPLAMILLKNQRILAEAYSLNLDAVDPRHPSPVLQLSATIHPRKSSRCAWASQQQYYERHLFCSRYDGYRHLCNCLHPQNLSFSPEPFKDGTKFQPPVIILASKRPRYLHRCLTSLLSNRGLDITRLMVYVDGDYPEVLQLLSLMNVSFHQHITENNYVQPQNIGTKIAQNYKYAITHAFATFRDADKIVILEEDLEVSPDFISYFQQIQHLLDIDVSLYCISAWNDHGYNHSSADVSQLYRVGYLPGLGWMMRKDILLGEIFPAWPAHWKTFDWDVLLRLPNHRRGRDCIIPDVSRTYHFGFEGDHVNAGMQFKFFYDHAFNTWPNVTLANVERMTFARYRSDLIELIRRASALSGASSDDTTCSNLIPNNTTETIYIVFISMNNSDDTRAWEKLSTCLNLWDLDVRGDYMGVWRFWYNHSHILVMGVPYSDLSALALHIKGDVFVFSGERTANERRRGRWPPGLHRETDLDKRRRLRVSYDYYSALENASIAESA